MYKLISDVTLWTQTCVALFSDICFLQLSALSTLKRHNAIFLQSSLSLSLCKFTLASNTNGPVIQGARFSLEGWGLHYAESHLGSWKNTLLCKLLLSLSISKPSKTLGTVCPHIANWGNKPEYLVLHILYWGSSSYSSVIPKERFSNIHLAIITNLTKLTWICLQKFWRKNEWKLEVIILPISSQR